MFFEPADICHFEHPSLRCEAVFGRRVPFRALGKGGDLDISPFLVVACLEIEDNPISIWEGDSCFHSSIFAPIYCIVYG